MTLAEQVFARAVMLAGELGDRETGLLRVLCTAAAGTLAARLKEGIAPEDCREDFLTAASLMALAALNRAEGAPEEFKAGDLTVKGGGDAASRCLQRQAELLIRPYCRDCFAFLGV